MGRGSGGVTGTKRGSNKVSGASAIEQVSTVKDKLGLAIRQKDTAKIAAAESQLKTVSRKLDEPTLVAQHYTALRQAAILETKPPQGFTTTQIKNQYDMRVKSEFIFRKELQRRNPKKYSADWYVDLVSKANKNIN